MKRRTIEKGFNRWLIGVFALVLSGCGDRPLQRPNPWRTYDNPRFGFEFPYPRDWVASPPPSNLDGRTFSHPQNPQVTVTGWGGYLLERDISGSEVTPANFTTDSGVKGKLTVEVESQVTSIRLTLRDEGVTYYFEGRSPSEEFADYYRLFYDMASRYQIDGGRL